MASSRSIITTHKLNKELDLQSLFVLHVHSCTHWLRPRPPPRIWAHIRECYWSAKIDNISLCPPATTAHMRIFIPNERGKPAATSYVFYFQVQKLQKYFYWIHPPLLPSCIASQSSIFKYILSFPPASAGHLQTSRRMESDTISF